MTTLASLDHVTRLFGEHRALDTVSLEIDSGSILGLLGPNGAGKTTLLTLLMGLRSPTSGIVRLFGGNPKDAANRQRLGSTPQNTALPAALRVRETIALVAKHYERPYTLEEISQRFGLDDFLTKQTGALSGGQRRRVSVALAFVGRPDLVLLDEPTTGLDVDGRHMLWDAVRELHREGTTVVVTSHYLEEIEALAERVVVVDHGRLIADGSLANIVGKVNLHQVQLESTSPAMLTTIQGISSRVQNADGSITLLSPDSDALVRELVRANVPFENLRVRGATLEEAFQALTESSPSRHDSGRSESTTNGAES
ncbi:ABC transporter ATP-binding protein [Lysinibacter cavernae]|uniref:ABC-2 type transport system ATP-binding protein n=1 Tax=Lysinibacter cavernae TaxID=1640652 RepID=A0A7X5TTF8_9MICO|nr:ABC transporter ATP-binding protein [Lysinibacter cavernae]NIH52627.1 ABC-2 type transport system ATP-binding protein [Lysinibacter cavernae]